MISYETHVLPNSDYYVYTPSTLAKKLFFYPICTGSFRYESGYRLARVYFKGNLFCNGG